MLIIYAYDFHTMSEDYVHRRTGRINKKGTAYTFFTPGNMKQARDLIAVLKEANQQISLCKPRMWWSW
jgi:superfamily II DNA/RNA helicase